MATRLNHLTAADDDMLSHVFTHHEPTSEQIARYVVIRDTARDFARVILECCPGSADRTDALRKIREAVMTANASIALDGKGLR